MSTLILPMMMMGKFKVYEYEMVDGKKQIKKKKNAKGKMISCTKWVHYKEENGDVGIYPSVNQIYSNDGRGGKKLTKPAEDLFDLWHAKSHVWAAENGWEMTNKEKVVVEVTAYFPDKKGRDTNNVFKLMADAFEKSIYDNDHYALIRTLDFVYLPKGSNVRPYFEVNFFKKSDEYLEDVKREYEFA